MSKRIVYEYDSERQVLISVSADDSPRIIRRSNLNWRKLGHQDDDESYSRAIFLGQGCWERLQAITEEEAQQILTKWGYAPKNNN